MSNYLQEHRQGKLAVLFARKTYFFSLILTKAEMLALTKSDIDDRSNRLSITKTYYRTGGRI